MSAPMGSTGSSPPVAGRVQRRKTRTRAALLAAAKSLFAAQGVEPTTVTEIAARADISSGSFYNYFATKEDLLAALLEAALAEQLTALRSRQAQVTDPAETISVAHRHLILVARDDPDRAWLLVRLEVPHRVARAVLRESALSDLQQGIVAGRFKVSSRDVALTASGGALIAVMHSVLTGELDHDVDSAHAEGVLRSFGLDLGEASAIARRPLPPLDST